MLGGGTATDPTRDAPTQETSDVDVDVARRLRISEALLGLPVGFVVFHDVELPKPSRVVVDHVVIGPRSIWAVTTASYLDPIEVGQGRGADTLWAGRIPLRSLLESCEANAAAVGRLIGHPVEPLLCVDAPSTPDASFDFHGLPICLPHALVEQVRVTTTGFQDVQSVSAAVQRAFGTEPDSQAVLPTLGRSSVAYGAVRRARGWQPPCGPIHAIRLLLRVRRVVPILGIVALLTLLPNVVGMGTSVATRGVEKGVESVTDALTPSTLVSEAAGNAPAPPDVWYVVTCPEPGAGWLVSWVWPGDLPSFADRYGIETRGGDGAHVDHTISGWSEADDAPAPIRIASADDVVVITEYRTAAGETITAAEEPFRRPPGDC